MKTTPHEFVIDDQADAVIVPLNGTELEALDKWISMQGQPDLSRADGIRLMMIMALNDRRQQFRHDSWPPTIG